MSRTTYDNKALTKLTKQLEKLSKTSIQVGIFSDRATRRGTSGVDNPTLGAKHEFGVGVKPRSWLRMPLGPRFKRRLDAMGSGQFIEALAEDGPKGVTDLISAEAESQIQDAFDSGGFGAWPKWEPGYTNATGRILDDTSQMRNAVSSRIVSGGGAA